MKISMSNLEKGAGKKSVLLVIFLTFITGGIYVGVWFLRQRNVFNRLNSRSKINRDSCIVLIVLASLNLILSIAFPQVLPENHPLFVISGISKLVEMASRLFWVVLTWVPAFTARRILDEHYNKALETKVYFSKIWTFFFSIFYLQFKINHLPLVAEAETVSKSNRPPGKLKQSLGKEQQPVSQDDNELKWIAGIVAIVGIAGIAFLSFDMNKSEAPKKPTQSNMTASTPSSTPTPFQQGSRPRNILAPTESNVRPAQLAPDHPNSNDTWKEFNSETEQFNVLFPTYPTRETDTVKLPNDISVNEIAYKSKQNSGNIYALVISAYPPTVDVSHPDEALKNNLNGLASGKDNKLVYAKPGTLGKWRSLDFLIQFGGGYGQGRLILIGHKLYQLAEFYKEDNYNENEYIRFVNSFNVQDLKSSPTASGNKDQQIAQVLRDHPVFRKSVPPDTPDYYFLQGEDLFRRGDYDGAITAFSKVIAEPQRAVANVYWEAYLMRIKARLRIRDYNGVLSDYSKQIELHPADQTWYEERSRIRALTGDSKGAVADISQAVYLAQHSSPPLALEPSLQGDPNIAFSDIRVAIDTYTQAIKGDPTDPGNYLLRALLIYYYTEDEHQAYKDCSSVLKLDPHNEAARYFKAQMTPGGGL